MLIFLKLVYLPLSWQIFFLVVIFGLFHGLVYLPVLLSWIGPSAYTTADRRYKGDDEDNQGTDSNKNAALQGHDNLAMKSTVSIKHRLLKGSQISGKFFFFWSHKKLKEEQLAK